MGEMMQQQDTEQRERRCFEIAARLHMAMIDGYLTADEFEHCLLEFGILTDWRKHDRQNRELREVKVG